MKDKGCLNGVFQGVGSDCQSDTCPIGNVCCHHDVDAFCLTGEDDVERCTSVGQFAAEDCDECMRRLADVVLTVLSSSERVSLSGKKENVF